MNIDDLEKSFKYSEFENKSMYDFWRTFTVPLDLMKDESFVNKFYLNINWNRLALYCGKEYTKYFIKYFDLIKKSNNVLTQTCYHSLLKQHKLPYNFLYKYRMDFHWSTICEFQPLSINFIKKMVRLEGKKHELAKYIFFTQFVYNHKMDKKILNSMYDLRLFAQKYHDELREFNKQTQEEDQQCLL